MGKIPDELRRTIAANIRTCRSKKFPGTGGSKRCAKAFGVSPQQWSPWECGVRTPDETRLVKLAEFFGVTVEYLRTDHDDLTLPGLPYTETFAQDNRSFPPVQPAYFYCPFSTEQPLSTSMKDLCRLAEQLIAEIREVGLTIRIHPEDMEKMVELYLRRIKPL